MRNADLVRETEENRGRRLQVGRGCQDRKGCGRTGWLSLHLKGFMQLREVNVLRLTGGGKES